MSLKEKKTKRKFHISFYTFNTFFSKRKKYIFLILQDHSIYYSLPTIITSTIYHSLVSSHLLKLDFK